MQSKYHFFLLLTEIRCPGLIELKVEGAAEAFRGSDEEKDHFMNTNSFSITTFSSRLSRKFFCQQLNDYQTNDYVILGRPTFFSHHRKLSLASDTA